MDTDMMNEKKEYEHCQSFQECVDELVRRTVVRIKEEMPDKGSFSDIFELFCNPDSDTSDIVGIFMEEQSKRGERFTFERIDRAVKELYGSWDEITPEAKAFLDELLVCNDYDVLYSRTKQNELKAKQMLVEVQENFPEVLKQEGVKEVLRKLRAKTEAAKQEES